MAKVLGVGGIFFLCKDVDATRDWYRRVLGIQPDDYGGYGFLHKEAADAFPKAARTVWAPFKAESDYFAPSASDFMINLLVDDLDGVLARAKREGVDPAQPTETHDYGKFGWLMDPDGRKVELWQPFEPPA